MKLFSLLLLISFSLIQCFGQDKEYAKSIVTELCEKKYHGRGYSFNGDIKASKFIASELKKIGALPIGKTYFQPFTIPVNTFTGSMQIKVNNKELVPGTDFIIDPQCPTIKGYFQIVWIADENGNFPIYRIKKNTVLNTSQLNNLQPVGSVALTDKNLVSGIAPYQEKTCNITATKKAFENKPDVIYINISAKEIKHSTQNVIAYIPGESDSTIVYTAHYDHLGTLGKKTYFPGANDNASGVAMCLDLAKHIAESSKKPKYTTVFIFFSAEEIGLVGSQFFTVYPKIKLSKIKFLLNLDLVGTGSLGITVVNGTEHKNEFDILVSINELNSFLPEVKIRGAAANSDHYFFHEAGVPCFFIYAMGKETYYHNVLDKAKTIPMLGYEGIFKLILKFGEEL